jgi:hypothetical protein
MALLAKGPGKRAKWKRGNHEPTSNAWAGVGVFFLVAVGSFLWLLQHKLFKFWIDQLLLGDSQWLYASLLGWRSDPSFYGI